MLRSEDAWSEGNGAFSDEIDFTGSPTAFGADDNGYGLLTLSFLGEGGLDFVDLA